MYKLVLCLYASVLIGAEKVLERAEYHNRPGFVGIEIFLVYVEIVVAGVLVGYELPPFEIDVSHKVLPPGRLHRGLESEHKDAPQAHFLCKLVGSECLSETHFSIPQKLRDTVRLILPCLLEIPFRLLHRPVLLRAHRKVPCPVFKVGASGAQ